MKKIYEVRLYVPSERKGGESSLIKLASFDTFKESEKFFLKIWDENRLIFDYLLPDTWSDIFFNNWIMKSKKYLDMFLYLVEAKVDINNPIVYQDSVDLNNNRIKVLRLIYDDHEKKSRWSNEI